MGWRGWRGWRGGFTWSTAYLDMALILANASLDIVGKFDSLDKIHG
jgi:hypothetical protein